MSDDEFDSDEPQVTIAQAVQKCLRKFERCQTKKALQYDNWYENRLAEFRLWIAGAGALAGPKASLDARLEFETSAKEFMVLQLTLLELLLDQCLALDDQVSDASARDAATKNVDSALDQLIQYSLAIRKAGSSSRLRKADRTFNPHNHRELYNHLVALVLVRAPVLESFRSSLRSPSRYEIEINPNKLDAIQQRLIHANLRRRHRFQYAQVHAKRLAVNAKDKQRASDDVKKDKSAASQMGMTPLPNSNVDKIQNIIAAATKKDGKLLTDTTASAIDSSAIKTLSKSTTPSQKARTEISTTASKIVYPNKPKDLKDGRAFQCPCCRQTLPGMYADDKDVTLWRKHIAEDVCPYVCILPSCVHPEAMYVSKEAWLKHITKDHEQLQIWQCILCVPSAYFYDLSMFETHIRSAHEDSILDVSSYAEACESTAPPDILECPLCNWAETQNIAFESTALLDHIAEHVHSFALRSLPWTIDKDIQDDFFDDSERNIIADWLSKTEALHEDLVGERLQSDTISRPAEVFLDLDRDIVDDIQALLNEEYRYNGTEADGVFSFQNSYIEPEGYFDEGEGSFRAASVQTESSILSSEEDLDHFSTYRSDIVVYELNMSDQSIQSWHKLPDEITIRQRYQSPSLERVEHHLRQLNMQAEKRKGMLRNLAIIYYTIGPDSPIQPFDDIILRSSINGDHYESCRAWVRNLSVVFSNIDFLIVLDCDHSWSVIEHLEAERDRALVNGERAETNPEQLVSLIGCHPHYSYFSAYLGGISMLTALIASIDLRTKENDSFTPDELCDDINTELSTFDKQYRVCAVRYGGSGANRNDSIYPVIEHLESEQGSEPNAETSPSVSLWVVIQLRIQVRKAKNRMLLRIAYEIGVSINVLKRLRELAHFARCRVRLRKYWEGLEREREIGLPVNVRIRCRNWIKRARERLVALRAEEDTHWLGLPPGLNDGVSTERIHVSSSRGSNRERSPSPSIGPLQRRYTKLELSSLASIPSKIGTHEEYEEADQGEDLEESPEFRASASDSNEKALNSGNQHRVRFAGDTREDHSSNASDASVSDIDNPNTEQTEPNISRSSSSYATERQRNNKTDSNQENPSKPKAKIYYQPEAFAFFGNTMLTRMGNPFRIKIPNAITSPDSWWGELSVDEKAKCMGKLAFPKDKWLNKFHIMQGDLAIYWRNLRAILTEIGFDQEIHAIQSRRPSMFRLELYVVSKDGTASTARPVVTAVGEDKRLLDLVCVSLDKNEHIPRLGALVTFRVHETKLV